ncbi:MAG: SpoIIE family protein phosphatase [Spirochaetales bacterium]|nr:SpoIIE family protein phosphatase [Spirochaetales bacterium]
MDLKVYKFYLLFVIFLFIQPLFNPDAEEKSRIKFHQIDNKQGLFAPNIGAIIQDNKGFIWIGSFNAALFRYDGKNFKVYKNNPDDPHSLPALKISCMYLDKYNTLWIGMINGIVAFNLEKETFTHYTNKPDDPYSVSGGEVTSICEDTGSLWIGTSQGGLCVFHYDTGKFSCYNHNPANTDSVASNTITSLCKDKADMLWIGTDVGADMLNRETGEFTHFTHNPQDSYSLSNNYVNCIITDRSGRVWIATNNGLNEFDYNQNQFRRYFKEKESGEKEWPAVSLIYEGPVSGKLWSVIENELYEFDREKKKFIFISRADSEDPGSISISSIYTIFEDASGILWIGGFAGYLNTAKLVKKNFINYMNDPDNPYSITGGEVHSIDSDASGLIWIATVGGGINGLDRKTGKVMYRYKHDPANPSGLMDDRAYSVFIDSSRTLWAGTFGGINRLNKNTNTFVHYTEGVSNVKNRNYRLVFCIYEDHEGDIWAGGLGGLSRYDRQKDQFIPYRNDPDNPKSMHDNNVFSIIQDRSGTFWIGSVGGMMPGFTRFDKQKEEFTHYLNDPLNPNSISTNIVYHIYEDEDEEGILWLSTKKGLNRFDMKSEKFSVFTEHDGLAGTQVIGVIGGNDGNLWISCLGGISKFDKKNGTFRSYDETDGLSGDYFTHGNLKTGDGQLFLGGGHGVTAFYPEEIVDNPYIPPIAITEMMLFNKIVPIGKIEDGRSILEKSVTQTGEIELLYKDYVFSFEFAALSFVDSHKNQFAYIMDGFEKEWNYAGTRNFVTYTNLDAGKYTLKVKASNNDGVWNEQGISLKIKVLPPFWGTWWFQALIIILLVMLVAAVFIFTVFKLKSRHKAQMIKREIEIARNIQTSLLPDLNLINDTGYEFEGNMIVAEPVGGDYYDVIKGIDGRLWLGIGDVSGHGISAGLIMMMAQVAIHNLIGNVPGITPVDLLTQVNKIMTKNIREKMKTNQYMTINFLVENNPGHFSFAGAHETILIHKAKTGDVIQVETDGFWLGILEDCALQISNGKGDFQLEKNDTLLLYTDGVIEIMNKNHEQFDLNRVIEVMKNNCENPLKLKNALNDAHKDFGGIQKDDIAFLICKRKYIYI